MTNFCNRAGTGVSFHRTPALARGHAPCTARPAPRARYLHSFLVTEQLEGAAVVLGEGGDLEVKCWRPPLSLLGKRLGLKTELDGIVHHLPFLPHGTQQNRPIPSRQRWDSNAHIQTTVFASAAWRVVGPLCPADLLGHLLTLACAAGRNGPQRARGEEEAQRVTRHQDTLGNDNNARGRQPRRSGWCPVPRALRHLR